MSHNKPCLTDKFSRQVFLRQHRLLTADDFSRVFKKPFRSSDCYLTILAVAREKPSDENIKIDNTDILSARLGLAISKKNTKRAVDRNRIKRLIRESFRQNKYKLPAIDLVVMAKPVTKNADNAQIFQSLEQHWDKLVRNFKAK